MSRIFTKTTIAQAVMIACSLGTIIPIASADELDLPTAPLVTTKSVKPNMMLLLDSSTSMFNIVPQSPYDPEVSYFTCDDDNKYTGNVDIFIDPANGNVTFANGKSFGNGNGGKCFQDDKTDYNARLYAYDQSNNSDHNTGYATGYGRGEYTGRYLNWYFSNTTFNGAANFGANAKFKPDTKSRLQIAKDSARSLVQSLEKMRVGLSIYTRNTGANILSNMLDIDVSGNKSTLDTKIAAIDGVYATPLGESLQDLGRYFSLGTNVDLTLHPDDEANKDNQSATTIFKNSPTYTDIIAPNNALTWPITDWCQESYIVALTDGLPSQDDNISTHLQHYAGGTDDDYADDVVKALYDMDLRPDLTKAKNNITTYMVGFAEPQVINSQLIKNMANYGVGSPLTGDNLLVASNGEELAAVLETATNTIFAKVAAGSGAAFNTSQFSDESSVYAASFNSAKWSGNLKAFDLSDTGEIDLSASWDAASKLDAMDYEDRNIFSYNSKGVVFHKDNLSSAQLADLQSGPKGSTEVASLINYLKGDRTNEGSGSTDYRIRTNPLGDIANSTVVYVGSPQLNWPSSAADDKFGATNKDYSTFKSDKKDRAEMLYVGANDGMLHGFSAADGEEKFAYIPSIIASVEDEKGLHYLAENDYAHQFYVDLTPTVSDVYIDSAWRTVLIGGLRSGGKGLFALDITDPTKFDSSTANAEALALWEFSSTDDADFGYSYSKPTVAMMANGEWAVIVGNGYNSGGNAKLFIIYLDKNGTDAWSSGNNYQVIDTGDMGAPNGLSTPRAVDLDGDSVVDRIYAGDLLGNMWAFDVSGNTNQWSVAYKDGSTPKPLFTATDGTQTQPITTAPIVAENINTVENEPDILVFFGTGKYLEESDKTSTPTMSYYGVLDDGSGGKARSNLTERKLITSGNTRAISGANIDWTNTDGWYFDLLNRSIESASGTGIGERIISNSLIRNGILLFPTAIPNIANTDICVSNSESWLMAVDLNTGKAPLYSVFDINSDGSMDDDDAIAIYDSNGDGEINEEDNVSAGGTKLSGSMVAGDIAILGDNVYSNDVDGVLTKEEVNIEKTEKQGRLSWEELIKH